MIVSHSVLSFRVRGPLWLAFQTFLVHLLSLVLAPQFMCGCHPSVEALLVMTIPVLWSIGLFVVYTAPVERLLA